MTAATGRRIALGACLGFWVIVLAVIFR